VSGAELRTLFERMGFDDVAAFRTSGNVVFSAGREPAERLTGRIEKTLEEALGHEAVVFLRSAAEVLAIAAHEPFDAALVDASKGKLQVSLLRAKPAAGVRREVLALATDDDRLAFGDRELYWLPSGGTQSSELDAKSIEGLLGPATMRTKGTIEQLTAKFLAG
jgi:uncharacterized protein (DUF1697 family)